MSLNNLESVVNDFRSVAFEEDVFTFFGRFPKTDKHRLLYDGVQEIINHDYCNEDYLKLSDRAIAILFGLPFRNDGLEKYIYKTNFVSTCRLIYCEFFLNDEMIKICKQCAGYKDCKNVFKIDRRAAEKNIMTSRENYCELCKNRLYIFENNNLLMK